MRRSALLLALLALPAALPGSAAAQAACAAPAGGFVGVVAGLTRSDLANGTAPAAYEAGLAAARRLGRVGLAAEAGLVLDDGPARRPFVRVAAAYALFGLGGVSFCGAALGGVAAARADAGDLVSLGGGLALTALLPLPGAGGRASPYVSARVLGAATSGEVLGASVRSSGASLGGGAGVAFEGRRLAGSLGVTLDAFDPGLGGTPYPDLGFRLTAGWRF